MFLSRFEYVASVVLPIFAVSLSYFVEAVVSAVSMCSQKLRVAVLHPEGIVTLWESVSVCVRPTPFSQAKVVPPWAAWPARLVTMPVWDWVQGEAPLSKPPLATAWVGVQAAATGALGGAAAAGVAESAAAASAARANALVARALWGWSVSHGTPLRRPDSGLLGGRPVGSGAPEGSRGLCASSARALSEICCAASPWVQGDDCRKSLADLTGACHEGWVKCSYVSRATGSAFGCGRPAGRG